MKHLLSSLFLFVFVISLVGCSSKKSEEKFKPTPIVIDTNKKIQEMYHKGTITFKGDGVDSWSYEGTIQIAYEGNKIHIYCGDAVESHYDECF